MAGYRQVSFQGGGGQSGQRVPSPKHFMAQARAGWPPNQTAPAAAPPSWPRCLPPPFGPACSQAAAAARQGERHGRHGMRARQLSVERAWARPVTPATSNPAGFLPQHGNAGVVLSRSGHGMEKRRLATQCLVCAGDIAAPLLPCQAVAHGEPLQQPQVLPRTSKKPGWRASASGPSSTKWRKASCRYTVHMRGTCMGQEWSMGRGVRWAI